MGRRDPLLPVGILKGPHGLKGWAYFLPYSGDCSFLSTLPRLYLRPPHSQADKEVRVAEVRAFKKGALLRFSPPLTREELLPFRNAQVLALREELPPPHEGEVYLQDLLGLRCLLPGGEQAGVVQDALMVGRIACLVVEGPKGGYVLYHHDWTGDPSWEEGILPLKRRPLPFDF